MSDVDVPTNNIVFAKGSTCQRFMSLTKYVHRANISAGNTLLCEMANVGTSDFGRGNVGTVAT
jgi:hypothetical protein